MDSDLLLAAASIAATVVAYVIRVIEQATSHCLLIGYDAFRLTRPNNEHVHFSSYSRIEVEL